MGNLSHGGVLPWVLAAVQEEDVVTCDVEATIVLVGLLSVSWHVLAEDAAAVSWPEGQINGLGAHGLLQVGRLEEAKLIAILVAPLSQVLVDVDGCVTEGHSVILIVGQSSADGQISDGSHQSIVSLGSTLFQRVAHGDASAILHTHREDVCVVEEEIRFVDWDRDVEQIGNLLSTFISLELTLDDINGLPDGI